MSSFNAIFDKNRLVLARQLAGIRKNELAAKAGVSASAITTWESGDGEYQGARRCFFASAFFF